ncbi:MAG: hypothetical protein PHF86_10400 [Candidatus Nanoarchaeia archaeon]|nr:hypothetical protein [Candidatus Nanoarchaeia archaeon]
MNELTKLVNKIKETKAVAESSPGEDPTCYSAKLGNIKRAKENLEGLMTEYRDKLKNRTIFILVTGNGNKKFAKFATKDYKCFKVEAEDFYERIIKEISPKLYTNFPSSVTLFDQVTVTFEDMAMELGIMGFPSLMFETKYKRMLKDEKDFLKLLTEAFNNQIGSEVVGLYALTAITKEAVEREYDGQVVPILITSENQQLISDIQKGFKNMFNNTFVVQAGKSEAPAITSLVLESVTKEAVEECLVKINKNIK